MQPEKGKPYVHFTRKPFNSFQRQPQEVLRSQNKSIRHSSSTLKLHQNTVSIAIGQQFLLSEDLLSQSLCSIDSTPMREYCGQKEQQSRQSTYLKLEYSPDSILLNIPQQYCEDFDLLLNDSLEEKSLCRYEMATTTSQSQRYQSRSQSNHALCSIFTLGNSDESSVYSFRAILLTLNSYIFKIEYRFKENKDEGIVDHPLVKRIKKFFKEKTIEIFNFYELVLKKYSSQSLRIFLIQKNVKFTSPQIQSFQTILQTILTQKTPDEDLELLIFTKDTDDELIVNLSKEDFLDSINLSQPSLWSTFSKFIKNNNYFRSMFSFEVGQLQSFLRALV